MRKTIALDADGVLLDYHAAYRQAWAKAFGVLPELRDSKAYWPIDRWDVQKLSGAELASFRACFDEEYWANIPAISGAVAACQNLSDAGYELVCVSAIESQFETTRLNNLQNCGFPITRVVATANSSEDGVSPKTQALQMLNPLVFVDDFAPYLLGIPGHIHKALILREPNGSPNVGENLALADSYHADLMAFSDWWIVQANN